MPHEDGQYLATALLKSTDLESESDIIHMPGSDPLELDKQVTQMT